MKHLVVVILGIAILMPFAAPPAFGEEETFVNVKTTTTLKADGLRLSGRISAPFSPRGEDAGGQDCLAGRDVTIAMKKPAGYRTVAGDASGPDGSWRARVGRFRERYRITIATHEFSYSPRYGQLDTVRCLPATITGTLRRRGFEIDHVLGERIARATSEQALSQDARAPGGAVLPATGSHGGALSVAAALIVIGTVLHRLPLRRTRRS